MNERVARAELVKLEVDRLLSEARSCTDPDRLEEINAEMQVSLDSVREMRREQLIESIGPPPRERLWPRLKEPLAWTAGIAATVLVFGAMLAGIVWADRSSEAHKRDIARRANIACGRNHPIELNQKDSGHRFIVVCPGQNGTTYEVVIR